MIIAIDGPAGSGKSTISKILSKKLGFIYLDTGAMYRALTLKVLESNIASSDDKAIIELAANFDFKFEPDQRVILDARDVTDLIRTPEIEKAISKICSIPKVRSYFVLLQRKIASISSCVTDGRDTTTVVFPQAELKIFLDASVEERSRRRLIDFKNKNINTDFNTVKDNLVKRDQEDRTRVVGALKKALDAVVIDTTGLTIEQVADKIYQLA